MADDRDSLMLIVTDGLTTSGIDPTVVDRAAIVDSILTQWWLTPRVDAPDMNITITDTEWHHVATGITVRFLPG
jgi:hypothetical protein